MRIKIPQTLLMVIKDEISLFIELTDVHKIIHHYIFVSLQNKKKFRSSRLLSALNYKKCVFFLFFLSSVVLRIFLNNVFYKIRFVITKNSNNIYHNNNIILNLLPQYKKPM